MPHGTEVLGPRGVNSPIYPSMHCAIPKDLFAFSNFPLPFHSSADAVAPQCRQTVPEGLFHIERHDLDDKIQHKGGISGVGRGAPRVAALDC